MKGFKGSSKVESTEMKLNIQSTLFGDVDRSGHTITISDENMQIQTPSANIDAKRIYNTSYIDNNTHPLGTFRGKENTRAYKWAYEFDEANEYEYLRLESVDKYGGALFAKYITFRRPKKADKSKPSETSTDSSSNFKHPVDKRSNKVFQEIMVDTDSIKVDLYDVAEIDGDSVSLFLNDRLIAEHKLLKAEATTLYLKLDRNLPANSLVIFAENLGRIPPNTAYVVITVNNKEYKLYMQSDEKTNGEIVFRFPK